MTNDEPPPRSLSVRARLLSVTGIAVLASLLVWHGQIADFLGFGSPGDKAPVVGGSGPAGRVLDAEGDVPGTPEHKPTTTPRPKPKPSKTPKPKPIKTKSTDNQTYDEESTEGMSPKLRSRLLKAMAAAKADGVDVRINSGRRSAAKQRRLLDEAIEKYGSYKAAVRWVLPPEFSEHVKGRAVDITPATGAKWLELNGYKYGICRRYDNEPWHFEALSAPGRKCPPREPYALAK
ncbi:M15 family metallopeptidase [Kribbella sp. NPDC051770]|uniref:M15 family metallopeptidase n=1 Tax=Kribbella sp. NPDC051770 TaxID=3155413 RepID=UPI003413A48A